MGRAVLGEDGAAVIDVDYARGGADGDISVHSGWGGGGVGVGDDFLVGFHVLFGIDGVGPVMLAADPAEGKNCSANSAFIQPANDRLPPLDVPLRHFSVLACNAHS